MIQSLIEEIKIMKLYSWEILLLIQFPKGASRKKDS